jgi:hypothetical protein
MLLGSQAVILRSLTNGDTRNRLNQPNLVPTEVTVTGCLMRPFRSTEVTTLTDVSTQVWRCTAPPVNATLNATAADELDYGTDTYQITGVEAFPDRYGVINHVRITCQLQAS